MIVLISLGPRQHFCFSTPSEKAHAFSCALPIVKSLSWFRFDWNVQHYLVSIRKTSIDIFVALTELRKKIITHIVPQKNTHNFIFAWKSHTKISLHKKTTQNFTCTWPEHSTIASSWMLKCNAFAAVVVVAEKMWISQNMLWLPCSGL